MESSPRRHDDQDVCAPLGRPVRNLHREASDGKEQKFNLAERAGIKLNANDKLARDSRILHLMVRLEF
jgi:hypothetical protein